MDLRYLVLQNSISRTRFYVILYFNLSTDIKANRDQINTEKFQNLNTERDDLVRSAEEFKEKLAIMQEDLVSKQDEILLLREEKMQLEMEKQELRVVQMDSAVSSESKNLADSVLNEVQMAELKKTNEDLSTENLSLADNLRTTMDQLAMLKEQVECAEGEKTANAERMSNEFLSKIKQQEEAIAQLQTELEQASQRQPQEKSNGNKW